MTKLVLLLLTLEHRLHGLLLIVTLGLVRLERAWGRSILSRLNAPVVR